jgi:hypothetical protein
MLTHAKRIGFVVSKLAKNFCATFSRASSGHSVNLQEIVYKESVNNTNTYYCNSLGNSERLNSVPVDSAAIYKRREHSQPIPECISHRAHRQYDVKISFNTLNKIRKESKSIRLHLLP